MDKGGDVGRVCEGGVGAVGGFNVELNGQGEGSDDGNGWSSSDLRANSNSINSDPGSADGTFIV